MNNKFFYDEKNDILSIHKGFISGEKFKTNIDAGSVVLDLSNNGRVVGIELMNASEILANKSFDISGADFSASMTPKNILIKLFVKIKGSTNSISTIIAVPFEKSLVV
jgi:uncharacterized protein YuzE